MDDRPPWWETIHLLRRKKICNYFCYILGEVGLLGGLNTGFMIERSGVQVLAGELSFLLSTFCADSYWYTELWHLVQRTMSRTQNYGIWYRQQWCLTELEVGVVGADVVAGTHDSLHDERHSDGIQQAVVLGYPILPLQTSILLQQLAVQQVSEDVHTAPSAISPSFNK